MTWYYHPSLFCDFSLLTSSPTVSTISYFFLWNFPYFIAIFHLQKHPFLYLEVHTGPWKQYPTLSPTVGTTTELTNAPYSPAWVIVTGEKKKKFIAATRTPDTPTDHKNIFLPPLFHKIYSKAIPAQKYFFKMWQQHLRVHPPKIYPYCISLTKYILQLWHRHYHFCVTFQGPCIKIYFWFGGFLWVKYI